MTVPRDDEGGESPCLAHLLGPIDDNPLRAHEPLHARIPFTQAHFDRWVGLFVDTIDELFVGPTADTAKQRGRKMAAAMQRLLNGVSAAGDEPLEPLGGASSVRSEAL